VPQERPFPSAENTLSRWEREFGRVFVGAPRCPGRCKELRGSSSEVPAKPNDAAVPTLLVTSDKNVCLVARRCHRADRRLGIQGRRIQRCLFRESLSRRCIETRLPTSMIAEQCGVPSILPSELRVAKYPTRHRTWSPKRAIETMRPSERC